MSLASLLLLSSLLSAQTRFDLLLKGGHVIDPKNGVNGRRDVAIRDGKIAAVAPNLDPSQATKTVDVSGLYVTPGLVDIHVHVFAGGMGESYASGRLSVFPDGHTLRTGTTTVVDAGTSGWRNFAEFKARTIDRAKTRVLAFLNIVGAGMGGAVEQNTEDMDPVAAAKLARQYPNIIVGFKTAHYAGPEWIAVDRALEAGKLANLPIMVDFGTFRVERPFEELVTKRLRPGDMYTHFYLASVPMLDENGKVRDYLRQARQRGVIFDVGHGGGSFVWRQAVPAMQQGLPPDSISTDLHYNSMLGGMKDMLNLMSKFLAMGMSLEDVILRSTWNPAKQIKRTELGHLSVGAGADVAVLRLERGKFGFVDVYGAKLEGSERLACELTLRDGKVVWDLNGLTREDWRKLGKNYMAQGDPVWDGSFSEGRRPAPRR
ncbi:MAG: amidohydrolase/deacetylase family metallohydrolase [Bryobacteraceae bacterium]|nr:amidohydrolase/deacetylase family metallohydrolase [Bryobacteraceae bacterium]MDW8376640.1 amidohydrolase/deacetylase family metallohydrolase [Bryobacterales bacterium]